MKHEGRLMSSNSTTIKESIPKICVMFSFNHVSSVIVFTYDVSPHSITPTSIKFIINKRFLLSTSFALNLEKTFNLKSGHF
jgi:hypothetical protein